jgi:hypothetical protein
MRGSGYKIFCIAVLLALCGCSGRGNAAVHFTIDSGSRKVLPDSGIAFQPVYEEGGSAEWDEMLFSGESLEKINGQAIFSDSGFVIVLADKEQGMISELSEMLSYGAMFMRLGTQGFDGLGFPDDEYGFIGAVSEAMKSSGPFLGILSFAVCLNDVKGRGFSDVKVVFNKKEYRLSAKAKDADAFYMDAAQAAEFTGEINSFLESIGAAAADLMRYAMEEDAPADEYDSSTLMKELLTELSVTARYK